MSNFLSLLLKLEQQKKIAYVILLSLQNDVYIKQITFLYKLDLSFFVFSHFILVVVYACTVISKREKKKAKLNEKTLPLCQKTC